MHPVGGADQELAVERVVGAAAKWKMRECSRKRPMIERMRMFSVKPGTPGARQQRPRTIRSTGTPGLRGA